MGFKDKNEKLELMINSVLDLMKEQGYKTLRFSESNGKISTTQYDCIVIKDSEGREFTIEFNESVFYNIKSGKWEGTNYLQEDDETKMEFYEFNEFGYYALIGASSEEEAVKYYEEVIGEIEEEDGTPDKITKEDAKSKLLNICKNKKQRHKAIKEFTECINQIEPYLILIDGSLI